METNTNKWAAVARLLPDEATAALENEKVTDLFINPDGSVWVDGFLPKEKIAEMDMSLRSRFMKQMAHYFADIVTEKAPVIDGYIREAALRVEGAIEPASHAPACAIRKLSTVLIPLENYVEIGIITEAEYDMILQAIELRANIIIAGSTGSGKTTLLNAFLQKLAVLCASDRVVTVEDTEELQITMADCWPVYTTKEVGMSEQIKRCLRRRPDRVIVGEVRDGAILDMMNMWNTGHDGGLGTIHAGRTGYKEFRGIGTSDLVTDALERMEDMLAQRVTVTDHTRNMLVKTIDLIVVINRRTKHEAIAYAQKPEEKLEVQDIIEFKGVFELKGLEKGKYQYGKIESFN